MIIDDEKIRKAIEIRINNTISNIIDVKLSRIIAEAVEEVFKDYFENQLEKNLNNILRAAMEEIMGDFAKEHKKSILELAEKILEDKLNKDRMFSNLPFKLNIWVND